MDPAVLFSGYIVSFDLTSSNFNSEPMARTGASEKAVGAEAGYIAATAAANDLAFATREAGYFMAAGLKIDQALVHVNIVRFKMIRAHIPCRTETLVAMTP